MPAANIMAIQLTGTGFFVVAAEAVNPNRQATPKMKKTKTVPASTNSHPVLSRPNPGRSRKLAKLSGQIRPHATMAEAGGGW